MRAWGERRRRWRRSARVPAALPGLPGVRAGAPAGALALCGGLLHGEPMAWAGQPAAPWRGPTCAGQPSLSPASLSPPCLMSQFKLPGLATSAELFHCLRRRGVLLSLAGSSALLSSQAHLWHLANLASDSPIRFLPLQNSPPCSTAALRQSYHAICACTAAWRRRAATAKRCLPSLPWALFCMSAHLLTHNPLQPGGGALGTAQTAAWGRGHTAAADAVGCESARGRLCSAALLAAGARGAAAEGRRQAAEYWDGCQQGGRCAAGGRAGAGME